MTYLHFSQSKRKIEFGLINYLQKVNQGPRGDSVNPGAKKVLDPFKTYQIQLNSTRSFIYLFILYLPSDTSK